VCTLIGFYTLLSVYALLSFYTLLSREEAVDHVVDVCDSSSGMSRVTSLLAVCAGGSSLLVVYTGGWCW